MEAANTAIPGGADKQVSLVTPAMCSVLGLTLVTLAVVYYKPKVKWLPSFFHVAAKDSL
jgi:hypothetical protein